MNTMTVDGVTYELIPHGKGCTDVPSVVCNGKAYIGQAMPNKRQKDYEILSGGCTPNEDQSIYRVKRLSDEEVFTIGDKTTGGTISSFSIWNNRILVSFKEDHKLSCYLDASGDKIEKVNQPLFTSEDGVDIYEKDMVWYLDTHFHIMYAPATLITHVRKDYKYFSAKELAKQWVILNKPCLSVNDIRGWLERYFDYPNIINANELMEIVKEKINATT